MNKRERKILERLLVDLQNINERVKEVMKHDNCA
jgi:hypothetical protein